MEEIAFIGGYDKTDLVLYIARILTVLKNRVLVIDTTLLQKSRYIVPVMTPSQKYITTYEDIDVAVDFANKQHAWHQYLLIRYGWAIDPAKVKTIALNRFDTLTGLENYYPAREKEVIAPLLPSECVILDISGNNRKPVETFEQIMGI